MESDVEASAVWKWLAAGLLSFMLLIASGTTATAIALLTTPSQDEVDIIDERQQLVLQRLAGLDILVAQNQAILTELREDIEALRDEAQR